ncbi:uncharacterized protein LOC131688412 [Topomyia yanbarensis]|uniref:uncharacterized protein LOC131688412 n=1 Tax=Topomyia yanbarensis TaxID=2498891 RepID=UPI00273CC017|nr:uncharacterized protein LOC131688412 [Topomyia yanbarensis]
MNQSAERAILNATSYSLGDWSRSSTTNALDDSEICDESVLQLLDKPFSQLVDGMQLRRNDRYAGFDNNAGNSWIYPTNYPVRKYQFSITQAALFKNTLVVLPTGLGKTFIAAVVMYNIYRWYPTGKVIFMAPTRPLVNQQIEACYKIMGIPKADTAEMTGRQQKKNRTGLWQEKRVFFVTPQVVQADINAPEQNFPTESVKLIVIDEAHKAKGRYAYTEVIRTISATNRNFRILALSATPGRTLEDVAEVIKNLLIAHIEVRWENSIDVSPYTFKKNIRTIVIPLGPTLTKIRDDYIQVVDPYVRRLLDANVISGHSGSLSRGWLIMEQKRFREASLISRHPNHSNISSDFCASISLYHAMELLLRHGTRAFLNFFEDEGSNAEKYLVMKDPRLKAFLEELRATYGRNPLAIFNNAGVMPNGAVPKIAADESIDFGHPKFGILERNLKEHFQNNPDSKVIIFCEFRESVAMIHRLLLQNRPLIKPKCIVGQGGTGGGGVLRAVTQKEQIAAMKDFRSGQCNTLIATSVAEEGIDVGEVDLIICFDITKNPTRFVQRIGRTGRQRVGRVLMLVTEGKEHDTLKEVLASKDKTNQKLSRSREILGVLYRQSPRLVPPEFDPKCVETFIKIPEEAAEAKGEKETKRGKKRKSILVEEDGEHQDNEATPATTRKRRKKQDEGLRGTQDVRNFFRKVDTDLDVSEREIFSSPPTKDSSTDSTVNGNRSFAVPVDTSIRLGKTEQEQQLEKLMKPLLRHKAQIERGKFIKEGKMIALREEKVYNSVVCPNPLKKYFLESNVKQLRDMMEKTDALQVALGESDDDDLIILDDNGDCLKSEMRIVENLFEGRTALKERVEAIEDHKAIISRLSRIKPLRKPFQGEISNDQVSKFNELFNRFSTHCVNKNYAEEQFENKPPEPSPSAQYADDPSTSNLFDSQFYLPTLIEPDESSYQPVVPELPPEPPPKQDHTPINRNKSKFRVSELPKNIKRTPPDMANSPLLRAFNRSVQKAKNSDDISPLSTRSTNLNFQMVLEFFGLNDLDQMFEETVGQRQDSKFRNRLEAIGVNEKSLDCDSTLTQQIAELSRNLFDCKELNLEVQEASFLAKKYSNTDQKVTEAKEPEEIISQRELDLLEADLLEDDFAVIEAIPEEASVPRQPSRQEIPMDEFLNGFSDDEPPVKPTSSAISNYSVSNSSQGRRRELNLGIQSCLEELLEDDFERPSKSDVESDEIIPNSQEVQSSLPKTSQKNLDIGNLEDLLADSDDDLFGCSQGSSQGRATSELGNVFDNGENNTDQYLEVNNPTSQKENEPIEVNRIEQPWKEMLPVTPTSARKQASSNHEAPKTCEEKSPSLLRKKLNFSRLRLGKTSDDSGKLELNSAPVDRALSNGVVKSAFFSSCRPAERDSLPQVRQALERRHSFNRKNAPSDGITPIDTSVIAPRTKRKAIISSDSDGAKSNSKSEEEGVFQTAKSNLKSSTETRPSASCRGPTHRKKRRKRRNDACAFLLSQAAVSDDGEEYSDDEEDVLTQLVDDSIIHHGPDEEDAVDMRAKYLQSVRSPVRQGGFRIPAAPTRFMNISDIYSQVPNGEQSRYEECSFIVHEDEVADDGDHEEQTETESELDELERAEAILQERRRAKRLEKAVPKAKRRRKIVTIGSDSEQSSNEGDELKALREQMRSGSEGSQ